MSASGSKARLPTLRQAIEKCGRHLGVAEHPYLLTEAEVGGDDDAGALDEFAQHMEEQRTACSGEWQDPSSSRMNEFGVCEAIGDLPRTALSLLPVER